MNQEGWTILAFILLCVLIYTSNAKATRHIHICEKGGSVLFLSERAYLKLKSGGVDVQSFKCVEKTLKNEEIWELKALYKRVSVQ